MILLIDNYDSFTYNLYQLMASCGADVLVKRNDEVAIDNLKESNLEAIVISPGPCTPNEAGVSMEVIKAFAPFVPILGVCLGHQCLAQAFGGEIIKAKEVRHGKVSPIEHNGQGVFTNVEQNFLATRYHSLTINPETLPTCFEVTATVQDGTIMAIKHKHFPSVGVQFHPESVLTKQGGLLMQNFLEGRL